MISDMAHYDTDMSFMVVDIMVGFLIYIANFDVMLVILLCVCRSHKRNLCVE